MSNVEEFPAAAQRLTEFEALTAAAPGVLDAIPGAVYLCDRDGWLVRYNSEALNQVGVVFPRPRSCLAVPPARRSLAYSQSCSATR